MRSFSFSFSFALVAAGLAACESPSPEVEHASEATLATPSAKAVCGAIDLALARRRLRCDLLRMPTVIYLEENEEVECSTLASAVAAGDVVMDAATLAACQSELGAAGCETDPSWTFDPHGACSGIFRPVTPSAGCRMDLECGAGRYCTVANAFCLGTCRAFAESGDDCRGDVKCGYGVSCNVTGGGPALCGAAIAHPRRPVALVGERCNASTMCEPYASCKAGHCVVGQDLGGACRVNADCAVGICTAGTCVSHQPVGGPCASASDCALHLSCAAGVCAATCN